MDYESLLKKAMEKLPKKLETKERFEIPSLNIEISGSRTILRNFGELLTVLRREPNHLAKYLSKELATAGSIQGNILVFQGKISKELLQKKVGDYVKEFVYCKQCKEPDTKIVKEGRFSFLKCDACGAKHPVRSI
jgi:translation initiation factor 2 subunit 2